MNLKRFGIVEIDKLWRSAGVRDAHGGGYVHEVEVGEVGRGIGHKVWKKRKGID